LAARENRPTRKSLALSHADACNPLLQAHPTWAQGNTKAAGFPFCLSPSPLRALSRADPSRLGHAATIYSSVQGPLGSKHRQLARQVGASSAARHRQWRPSARPPAAESTTSSPRGGRATSGSVPSPSPPTEEEVGQTWPSRRRHLVGCRASRRCQHANGGHVRLRPRV
jgi:hypothetical protein